MFEKYAYQWLNTALDCGITENAYWDMTLAEVIRAIESYKRRYKAAERQQAAFDYILADAVGRSVSRVYSSSNTMPKLYELYPTLFDSDEIKAQEQARRDELSVLRFKQFAQAHNDKYKGALVKNE